MQRTSSDTWWRIMSAMLGFIETSLAGSPMRVLLRERTGFRIGPNIKRPRSGRVLKVRRSHGGAELFRVARLWRWSRTLTCRLEAKLHCWCSPRARSTKARSKTSRPSLIVTAAGVRQRAPQAGRLPGNWVHNGFSPCLEKGGSQRNAYGEEWFHIRQNKHHRWSLDEGQVYQYHLGGALHPHVRWWEAMDVPRRTIQFIELGDEITLVSLVCEDLAQ